MLRFGLVLAFASMLLTSFAGCGGTSRAESTGDASGSALVRVTAGHPKRQSVVKFSTQPARIMAFEEAPLHARLAGYVKEVAVDLGDVVKTGQVLLTIEAPEWEDDLRGQEAALAQARAQVLQAEAAVRAARATKLTAEAQVRYAEAHAKSAAADRARWESEYERMQSLVEKGSVTAKLAEEALRQRDASRAAVDEAAAGIESARAGIAQAEAAIAKAKADVAAAKSSVVVAEARRDRAVTMLAYRQIKAPFDGVVAKRHVDTGHLVQPATGPTAAPLFTIVSTGVLRVSISIPELEAPLVDLEDSATLHVGALGEDITGKVARTSWSLDPTNRSLTVEIDVENPAGKLRPGMYGTVTLCLNRLDDALTLPAAALVWDAGQPFCCTVAGGKVLRKPLALALVAGDLIAIQSGVAADDLVVLARGDGLKAGQAVEVAAEAEKK